MKKFLSFTLILALAVTCLVSCGGDDADTTVAGTDAATQAPATDAATEAPIETEADDTTAAEDETEAPDEGGEIDADLSKALAYWSFKTEDDMYESSWVIAEGAIGLTHENGAACIELGADDAQFNLDFIEDIIPVEDIANITIKVKNGSTKADDDKKGQIFLATTDSGAGHIEERSIFFDYATVGENAEWETIVIDDFSSVINWAGELTNIRLDITNHGDSGFVYIEYIIINGK